VKILGEYKKDEIIKIKAKFELRKLLNYFSWYLYLCRKSFLFTKFYKNLIIFDADVY
jgi:hypothetical protein